MLPIIQMPSPNCSARDGAVPRFIILHGTAGFETAQEVAVFFASTAVPLQDRVSAHYVVGRDGTIVQCVDESMAAWANGPITGPPGTSGDGVHHDAWWDNAPQWGGIANPNPISISIEHVKPSTDNSDSLTPAQQAASFALQLDICQRNAIPMRYATSSGGITGHYSMDPVNKSRCPGPYPWPELWPYLAVNGGIMIPDGWTDNGTTLTAPKGGHSVSSGFRALVLEGWDPKNVPLEEEHGIGIGNTQQLFANCALRWDHVNGVQYAQLGVQYQALQAQVMALQKQLATAQATPQATTLAQISADLKAIVAATGDALSKVTTLA